MIDLKHFVESRGPQRAAADIFRLVVEKKIKPDDISIRRLWEGFGSPDLRPQSAGSLVPSSIEEAQHAFKAREALPGAIGTGLFPQLTGALVNQVVMGAYEEEVFGLDFLVQQIPAEQKDATIVGVTALGELAEVPEGGKYETATFGEKYHKIINRKYGGIIALTAEIVRFNRTDSLFRLAREQGQAVGAKRHETIINTIIEVTDGDSWRPNGTKTTLYGNSSNDPFTSGTLDNLVTDVLADETDIESALTPFGTFKNEEGRPIVVRPNAILTGIKKAPIAQKIFGSSGAVASNLNSGVVNVFRGSFTPFASSWVDTDDADSWFIGEFNKQFVETEVFPAQVMVAPRDSSIKWDSDLVEAWKLRWMGGCGAITNRYVVKSTGGG